tara:strand:- start:265 stop:1851 length:1587 start_codon:yes stop_codon:yes gene_type:complete
MNSRNSFAQPSKSDLAKSGLQLSRASESEVNFKSLERLANGGGLSIPEGQPLETAVRQLVGVSGIAAEEIAFLALANAVGAAAGPACVLTFAGESVTPTLNLTFVGGRSIGESQYVEFPFSPLKRIVEQDVVATKDPAVVHHQVEEVHRRIKSLVEVKAKARDRADTKLKFDSESELEALCDKAERAEETFGELPSYTDFRIAADYRKARQDLDSAFGEAGRLIRQLNPLAITVSSTAEEILQSKKFALDRSVTNLAPHDNEMIQLLSAPVNTKTEIANLCRSGFDGGVVVHAGKVRRAPSFSMIHRVSKGTLIKYLKDSIFSQGVTSRSLILDLSSQQTKLIDFDCVWEGADEAYERLIGGWYQARCEGVELTFSLSREAVELFQNFCSDLNEHCDGNPAIVRWIEHWPKVVLKLALAVHLSSGLGVPTAIGADVMARAVGLLRGSGVEGLRTLSELGFLLSEEEQRRGFEIDVLIAKIRMKGPVTRRDLVRSYSGMKTAVLESLVSDAMARGLVLEADGKLKVSQG